MGWSRDDENHADEDAGDVLALTATLAGGDPLPAWLGFDAARNRLLRT